MSRRIIREKKKEGYGLEKIQNDVVLSLSGEILY